jgi:hypothetical protein
MIRRRRSKQTTSLEERLVIDAQKSRERADQLPAGEQRDKLLKRARQSETVAQWVVSQGLQPLK